MIQRIVIVGAGRTAEGLLDRLSMLAPVTVLDRAPEALAALAPIAREGGGDAQRSPIPGVGKPAGVEPLRNPITATLADGTSNLVLQDLRGAAGEWVALVAATGEDRTNLEVCRLGAALDFRPIVAIAIDPTKAASYAGHGARVVSRATLVGDVVESALRHDSMAIASNLGLGRGDIIEIKVLPSSPVIGQRLDSLEPEGWNVAAIYRDDKLVIPRGKTTIAVDDRLLLVGEPDVLPYVAENLRVGQPKFPVRHGPNVVVYLPAGRDRSIESEAEVLTIKTQAAGLIRLFPGATAARTLIEESDDGTSIPAGQRRKWFEDAPLEGDDVHAHARAILARRPGLVVLRAARRTAWQRLLGAGGRDSELCNLLPVPVLFQRGKPHYGRVVHLVTDESADARAAEASIDVARLLSIPLKIVRVDLPSYFGSPEPRVSQFLEALERRVRQGGFEATTVRLEGNPIAEVLRFTTPVDLVVVARKRARRDSFITPDVALRIASRAVCSTLVWTA